ncbi:MAG TPA: PP0621 family protein [Thermoanaerobaculia bacterium]|nr:PP0621 family protein [Thermoanaerobaculia bacterium]
MTRFLVIALLLVILGVSVNNFVQRLRSLGGGGTRRPFPPGSRPPAVRTEEMVRCTACGIHVPSSRALKSAGGSADVFCSEDCRRHTAS